MPCAEHCTEHCTEHLYQKCFKFTMLSLLTNHRQPISAGLLVATTLYFAMSQNQAKLHTYTSAYLSQQQAQELDQRLFETWDVSQLMELAGLSVAAAVNEAFHQPSTKTKILIVAGPGNNGGDGLVAARHLYHFGFQPTIVYPKPGKSQLFASLLKQCSDLDIPINKTWDTEQHYDVVLDAVFGFSFKPQGGVRAPFDSLVSQMRETDIPVVSIDVPSGWDVQQGDTHGIGVKPTMLISLTAPKLFAQTLPPFVTRHFLGGRFLPPKLGAEYGLEGVMALYDTGSEQIVELEIPRGGDGDSSGEGKL